ncbi:hypothetical protein BRAS3809_7490001 [Bradyrhizobium sp. STM 3809]|nr:hypothetical protein BRAS3809_7490001 [Bradyrhizobium sp. STM 3809]
MRRIHGSNYDPQARTIVVTLVARMSVAISGFTRAVRLNPDVAALIRATRIHLRDLAAHVASELCC